MVSRNKLYYALAVATIVSLLLGFASTTSADEEESDSGPLSKLQLHGFLTQAYATGNLQTGGFPPDGPTAEELSLGIPEDGTSNYRNMALQFRYEISSADIMIVQLSSRELGDSPLTEGQDEVELDWAFYERRLGDNTSVKLGRVLIPFGIFNEIRDVGTILPFYRPPFVFYREGAFTSETVDGIVLSHTFFAESDWSLSWDGYWGSWDAVEVDPVTEIAALAKNTDSYGIQLWLNTPVYGMRFGFSYQHRNTEEGLEGILRPVGGVTKFEDFVISLDANLEKWVLRGEYRDFENDPTLIPAFGADDFVGKFPTYYVQVGYRFTPKFRIFTQYEKTDIEVNTPLFTETQELTQREDLGISFNYLFNPSLVLKLEYHEVQGEDQSFIPVFGPNGFQLQPIYADLDNGNYTILSLSVSF